MLVLTPQPMTGALLGMLVELAEFEPVFPTPDERPEDALARMRPILVVMVDAQVDAYRSDLFVVRAQHAGVGVAVFGVSQKADAEEWARQHGLPYLELPADAEAFGRMLDQAVRLDRRARLSGDRRTMAKTERAIDGTLVFQDGEGHRWYIYDRRSGEDRRASSAGAGLYRVFVREDGMSVRYALGADELGDTSPATLERQLARATAGPM